MAQFCFLCSGDKYDHETCNNPSCKKYGIEVPCEHTCMVNNNTSDTSEGYLDQFWT